jgi:signal transduction histidine kinase
LKQSLPTDLVVESDPVLLAIILGNLCVNAVEHAPVGGALQIDVATHARRVSLSFRNATTELTAADVPHLFERFWRKDSARSDGRRHGLGLALAADCARLLGGDLTAQLHAQGTAAEIELLLELPLQM